MSEKKEYTISVYTENLAGLLQAVKFLRRDGRGRFPAKAFQAFSHAMRLNVHNQRRGDERHGIPARGKSLESGTCIDCDELAKRSSAGEIFEERDILCDFTQPHEQ